jgi:hypothetical protein
VLKLTVLTGCSKLQYYILSLYCGIDCYVAAVAYRVCGDVVLGYGWLVFYSGIVVKMKCWVMGG